MGNQLDRALEILLLLRSGKTLSAATLAERFEVSTRTIYRDMETLGAAGVPIYAEMGRDGGFRLLEGYFLPPVMLTENEAASLIIGLTLLRRLRVTPFPEAIATAEEKLLAVLPDHLTTLLARMPQLIGFERIPLDPFLLKWLSDQPESTEKSTDAALAQERAVVSLFLRAIFERRQVELTYHSPYSRRTKAYTVVPYGLLWDRDWWYLVGKQVMNAEDCEHAAATLQEPWLWRADRVLHITAQPRSTREAVNAVESTFDVANLLGRTWLANAMTKWRADAPVQVRVTNQQAAMLQQDWYYRYAHYSKIDDGSWLMVFGEDKPQIVFDLLRWLGPGAELVTPEAWRQHFRDELLTMAAVYQSETDGIAPD